MESMIVGISGKAGSGKSEVARYLVQQHGFVEVALADPIKRAAQEWFRFSDLQLWGPSEERNKPDARYDGLTPRKALQFLGTEVGRELCKDIWVIQAMRTAISLLADDSLGYTAQRGLFKKPQESRTNGVVISDVRFENEVLALRGSAVKPKGTVIAGMYYADPFIGPSVEVSHVDEDTSFRQGAAAVWKITRPLAGLKGQAGQHASEMEQNSIPEDLFTSTIDNQGSLDDLRKRVRDLLGSYA